MAVATRISVDEYLSTSYRPDCDYIDGEVLERNLGEFDHSVTQMEIGIYLRNRYPRLRRRILAEQRIQIRPDRFRIPDVCILAENAPREKILRTPPALCMEILSPEDRMSRYMERIADYFEIGVPACWIIDPLAHRAWVATPGQLTEATDGILRSGDFEMPLAEILE